ncbi:MAG: adenine-specific methyltransferase EcoRI family protein [Oscillospiraceae bacterium]|nr:adenine-specific methyltransferase EcoRI family protein [Oscillospiraceae bacterium]
MATRTLYNAKKSKADEFYTQLVDIEEELRHYKEQFRDKVIFCNCDDPYESNFFKFFAMSFNSWGLKKLIATCYIGSPIADTQLSLFDNEPTEDKTTKSPHKITITEVDDYNADGAIDLADVEYLLGNKKNTLTRLKGDGDFRSSECVELLKEADIVVTNPPFSLFREYVAQLIEFDKKFLIIGNKNALTYREIFRYIKESKLQTGYRNINDDIWFIVPDDYEYEKVVNGKKVKHIMACWFTNLDVAKHHEEISLYKRYTPEEYPLYYNYDAINVDVVTDIPYDYDGAMGVPVTFIDKHNPKQFEIIGLGVSNSGVEIGVKPYAPEHKKYRKEVQKRGAVDGDLYMLENGEIKVPYARVIIKRMGAVQWKSN